MTAFTAKREDGRALWKVVFDEVHNDPPDTIYRYADIGRIIDSEDLHEIYRTAARCNQELWKHAQRSLQNVRGVGYRMLRPQEHEGQAFDYRDRGRKRMKQAVAIMGATDLASLTDTERTRNLSVTSVLIATVRAVDHLSRRMNRHDDILRELTERVEALERP